MSAHFKLFLGEDRIPVINWINRHGSPEGRDLRFTVPTEVKAKLELHKGDTYRLVRDGESWDFELISVTQHGTGTNGVPAVGRVKNGKPAPKPQAKPSAGVGVPKPDGAEAEPAGGFKREKSSLKELLLKKKQERKAENEAPAAAAEDPKTAQGLPGADDDDANPPTAKGMPAVDAKSEEE